MPDDFLPRYEAGESLLALAQSYGISRTALVRLLDEAGVERRSYSDAGRIRASKMTSAERSAQAKAAHDAVRSRTIPFMEKVRKAFAKEWKAFNGCVKYSRLEVLMDKWLTDRGIEHVFQKSIGPYNVDFYAFSGVAVEILGGGWHGQKSRRIKEAERAKYILDLGLNMVFVWSITNAPMVEACADEIVSIVNLSRSDPTVRGKYWVIRGDGKVIAACRDDMDERALVVPSLCS
jgi:very-short-patch-repair endonuclease